MLTQTAATLLLHIHDHLSSSLFVFQVIPIGYAIMTSKSEEAYVPVIRKFRDLGLQMLRRKLVTDFEIALMNAFIRVYGPNLSISGCLFHYVVDVNEAVGRLQLADFIANNHDAQKFLRRLLAFPRLDSQNMAAGIQAIIDEAQRAGVYAQLYPLVTYHHNFWLIVVKPRRLSTNGVRMELLLTRGGFSRHLA